MPVVSPPKGFWTRQGTVLRLACYLSPGCQGDGSLDNFFALFTGRHPEWQTASALFPMLSNPIGG